MTSKLQEYGDGSVACSERVVISGMAGLFPDSSDVKQLSDVLYKKLNPVKRTNLWKLNHPELSSYLGSVPDLPYFDAQFFKVHYRLCHNMDPMSRKVLEQSFQAIYDAGLSPEHLSGKKVGVYIGTSTSDTEKAACYASNKISGFGISGCNKSMFANRISYWLNLKGPSMAIDANCCSSLAALELAYLAISRGDCEAAFVGGAHLCLHPQSSVHCARVMRVSKNGLTKSFNDKCDGCAKSEAINILFLQRAADALRIYADVIHIKCAYTKLDNTETGDPKFGFYRNHEDATKFMKIFYDEANVSPEDVEYVEAFGSATPEADKAELEAIDEVYCINRKNPLLLGTVMSNIGYSEAAAGISAVTKVLLGYHHGTLAANLHCDTPRQDVAGVRNGRIQILQDHREFNRTYTAINGLSISGVNAHVLLHGHYKPKDQNRYKSTIPRLVLLSGREERSVRKIINDLKSRPIDPEEHALLHNIHETTIKGHLGRGFVLLDTDALKNTITLSEGYENFDQAKRPLCFVYSGMGSQWAGMGKALMRIPLFAASIERCHRVLAPKGLDIVNIITSDDKKMFDNILHSFVGIAAIQIALTDILHELEIFPDTIIGHSVGEFGCAYADGCFTAEEMILSAYSRGLVSIQTPLVRGSMAAVGLGYREVSKLCPPEIDVACHNSSDSSTISGPAEIMDEFVDSLTDKGIFVKEVLSSNIAYHSRYIAGAGPGLLKYLSELIKSPKPRSARWLSTSIPQDRWGEPLAKYSSAEYHTNNLLNPVLFEETSKLIPSNAMIIEVAPHGLLQVVLKHSLPETCSLMPLSRRGHPDNVKFLLNAIGRLSMEGFNPKVKVLYPKVEFPVSTGTPMLSHLVEWAHAEKWHITMYQTPHKKIGASAKYILSVHDDEQFYLRGHLLRGKNLYPFAGALECVWDTFSMSLGYKPKTLSVQFHDVYLYTQPILHEQRQLHLRVSIHKGSGKFEILNDTSIVAEGIIVGNVTNTQSSHSYSAGEIIVDAKDVYQMLHARDYHYMNDFRSIHSVNESLTEAEIIWKNNWTTFIDGILQFNALRRHHDSISKPKFIQNLVIDVGQHADVNNISNDVHLKHATVSDIYNTTVCGGVTLHNVNFLDLPALYEESFTINGFKLSPLFMSDRVEGTHGDKKYLQEDTFENDGIQKNKCIGDLNSLHWVYTKQTNMSSCDDIKIYYTGINVLEVNRQLRLHLNLADHQQKVVIDFSGTANRGKRVMGIAQSEGVTSRIKPNTELLWPIPEHWSLEDAATVPLAYSMGFYILFVKSNLSRMHRVFVHGGAGALGQAVISIALAHGCEVFTTVSTMAKKRFLRNLFPQLKDEHIGNSREKSFGDAILGATKGEGCDILISCVEGDLKKVTLRCLKTSGHMFDVSVIPNTEDFKLGMSNLTRQRSYFLVDFSNIFEQEYLEITKQLQVMVSEGIARGYVRPLTRVTFAPEDAARAYRLVAASRHRGRVLLDLRQLVGNIHPRTVCSPGSCQLIISDNEAFALKLADKLINNGAQKLLLFMKNPSKCMDVISRLWKKNNVKIELVTKNIWDESKIIQEIQGCSQDNPVESVFIINMDNETNNVNTTVSAISAVTMKLNMTLKYFALVRVDRSLNTHTSLLPTDENKITEIILSAVKMMDINDSTIDNSTVSLNSAVNVLESALCSKNSTVLINKGDTTKHSLLHQLLNIAEIKKEHIPLNAPIDSTLKDMNIDISKLPVLQDFLRDVYEVNLTHGDILHLSIEAINDIEKDLSGCTYMDTDGLGSYFSKISDDELISTTQMVFLPTLKTGTTTRVDDFEFYKTYLCIIPGVEGHHARFTEMCERLKIPALVLQPGLERNDESIQQIARRYTKILRKEITLKERFILLGYESGVLVALEMAAILEDTGLTGSVYCIGGSPAEVLGDFKHKLRFYKTNEELQIGVLKHMYTLMCNSNSDQLDRLLDDKMDWNSKLRVCVNNLQGRISHSIQYAEQLIKASYERITQVLHYKPMQKVLRSKVISMRPRYSTEVGSILKTNTEHNVTYQYELQVPLSLASQDTSCAAIINRHLDTDVLKEFYNKNHCDTYIMNEDSFTSIR